MYIHIYLYIMRWCASVCWMPAWRALPRRSAYMYIYIYIYIYIYMYEYIYIYLYINIYIYIYMYIYVFIYICVNVYTYTYISIYNALVRVCLLNASLQSFSPERWASVYLCIYIHPCLSTYCTRLGRGTKTLRFSAPGVNPKAVCIHLYIYI